MHLNSKNLKSIGLDSLFFIFQSIEIPTAKLLFMMWNLKRNTYPDHPSIILPKIKNLSHKTIIDAWNNCSYPEKTKEWSKDSPTNRRSLLLDFQAIYLDIFPSMLTHPKYVSVRIYFLTNSSKLSLCQEINLHCGEIVIPQYKIVKYIYQKIRGSSVLPQLYR